jgi:hypothetical protein
VALVRAGAISDKGGFIERPDTENTDLQEAAPRTTGEHRSTGR